MSTQVFIISGKQGEGKTNFLQNLCISLNTNNIGVAGILALGTWKRNQRDSFTLLDITSGEKMIFGQTEEKKGWEKIRKFYINPRGEEFGKRALSVEKVKQKQVIVIDEIGPFELQGKGWAKELKIWADDQSKILILSVREQLVEEVIKHFKLINVLHVPLSSTSTETITKQIEESIKSLQ